MSQVCRICGVEKVDTEFYRRDNGKLRHECKICLSLIKKNRYINNREHRISQVTAYRNSHRDQLNSSRRATYAANPEPIRQRLYAKRNTKAHKKWRREHNRQRMSNPKWRIRKNVATHINWCLRGGKNGASWERLLDYTLADLMDHLEKLWQPGMSWDNYGFRNKSKGQWWTIDHNIPVSHWNITDIDDPNLRECWALTNLKPMWSSDNFAKRDRWADE